MLTAQIIMVATLLVMIAGRAPLYITATVGSTIAAVAAGFSLLGNGPDSVGKLLVGAMNPVIVDMIGVLLFIGIMQASGFMDVIIYNIMEAGRKYGGAPGVATAAGLAAAFIGALTSFTQPVITATIAGPAATRLGLSPNKTSAIISMAATVSNSCGFTHPTMLAILGLTGVGFGLINVYGFLASIGIYIYAYRRARNEMIAEGLSVTAHAEDEGFVLPEGAPSFMKAFMPFILLCATFFAGVPVFLAGFIASLFVAVTARYTLFDGEKAMISGVTQIAIPIVAIISLMFMSSVINKIGLVAVLAEYMEPLFVMVPIQTLLVVSAVAGTVTQSNAASAAIILPFVQILLGMGVDPMAVSFAGIMGASVMQLFLTGGALTALPVVAGVIPGTVQREANRWQRPAFLVGLGVSFLMSFVV